MLFALLKSVLITKNVTVRLPESLQWPESAHTCWVSLHRFPSPLYGFKGMSTSRREGREGKEQKEGRGGRGRNSQGIRLHTEILRPAHSEGSLLPPLAPGVLLPENFGIHMRTNCAMLRTFPIVSGTFLCCPVLTHIRAASWCV